MRTASQQSQELEDQDDYDAEDYTLSQLAPPEPPLRNRPNLAERLVLWTLALITALLVWIFGRGAYLATRELWRWL